MSADLQPVADNELSNILSKAKQGVIIVCFFDCCHSGSMLDIGFIVRIIGSHNLLKTLINIKQL
jgi:hypothetical protein